MIIHLSTKNILILWDCGHSTVLNIKPAQAALLRDSQKQLLCPGVQFEMCNESIYPHTLKSIIADMQFKNEIERKV